MTTLSAEVSKLAPKLSGNLKINQKKQAVNNLVATLFNTVRMSEWEYMDDAYKFPLNKKLALWLTSTSVEVRKGIRVFPIGNGKDAERLFNNIKHAQAVIAKAVAEQDKQVTAFMEAFDIDAELAGTDDTVSADQTKVDIKIKPAPAVIEPAETSPESESAAALLSDEDKEELLSIVDDGVESDLFADALKEADPEQSEVVEVLQGGYSGHYERKTVNALKSLQGRVLGIVDASFSDKEQRTAVKTLINKEFRREIDKAQGGSNEN